MLNLIPLAAEPPTLGLDQLGKSILLVVGVAIAVSLLILAASYASVRYDDFKANR